MSAMQSNAVNVLNPSGISGEASLQALLTLSQSNKDRNLQREKMKLEMQERERDRAMQQEQFQTELQARQQSEEADRQFQISENDKARGLTSEQIAMQKQQMADDAAFRQQQAEEQQYQDRMREISEHYAQEEATLNAEYDRLLLERDMALAQGDEAAAAESAKRAAALQSEIDDLQTKLAAFAMGSTLATGIIPEQGLRNMAEQIEMDSMGRDGVYKTLTEGITRWLRDRQLDDNAGPLDPSDAFDNEAPGLLDKAAGLLDVLDVDMFSSRNISDKTTQAVEAGNYEQEKEATAGLGNKAVKRFEGLADVLAESIVPQGVEPGEISKRLKIVFAAAERLAMEQDPAQQKQWETVLRTNLGAVQEKGVDQNALAQGLEIAFRQIEAGFDTGLPLDAEAAAGQQAAGDKVNMQHPASMTEQTKSLLKTIRAITSVKDEKGNRMVRGTQKLDQVPSTAMTMAVQSVLGAESLEAALAALETPETEDDIKLFAGTALGNTDKGKEVVRKWSPETRAALAKVIRFQMTRQEALFQKDHGQSGISFREAARPNQLRDESLTLRKKELQNEQNLIMSQGTAQGVARKAKIMTDTAPRFKDIDARREKARQSKAEQQRALREKRKEK